MRIVRGAGKGGHNGSAVSVAMKGRVEGIDGVEFRMVTSERHRTIVG